MRSLRVQLVHEVDASYPISVGEGLLRECPALLAGLSLPRQVAIVSDGTVFDIYGAALRSALESAGFSVVAQAVFPAGEASKTRETKGWIEDQLLAARLGRDGWIAALGGGVAGDMAGFTAATYLRGIPFVQFPTTLLAMVDSSVGGKTGLDTPHGKNLIGAFWQPRAVVADINCLRTLPEAEYQAGLAEVIKHAVIADAGLFQDLLTRWPAVASRDADTITDVVARNCAIKAAVVEKDEREGDLRKILNYGHTLGHALETAAEYRLLHGACVALGMRYEGRVAAALGFWPLADALRVEALLDQAGFDKRDTLPVASEGLLELTLQDKKARDGAAEYVFPSAIGTMRRGERGFGIRVPAPQVLNVLKELRTR